MRCTRCVRWEWRSGAARVERCRDLRRSVVLRRAACRGLSVACVCRALALALIALSTAGVGKRRVVRGVERPAARDRAGLRRSGRRELRSLGLRFPG
eukprot:8970766-Alexandrium_andersonii.AAC.1